MTNDNRELSSDELSCVTGGGIADKVLPESEATDAFLKRFAESSLRISAFIDNLGSQASTAPSNGHVHSKNPPA